MGKRQGKLRVVLDTNALVSALLFGGEPGRLVSLWESGRIVPLVSRDVLLEYLRVLAYPKFGLGTDDIKSLVEEHILPFAEMVVVDHAPHVVLDDPGDDKFLALVLAGSADFLISGDKHLLALERYHGADILTPRNFLARPESAET
ncbi:MAG: putative toxin-antitoxin system toxin component, PIN family [Candidatus Aminicenantes bacterium]|nr:putative toxin-antitoxin system toxin component, PIN family [Candidatus Aminicenantes bacterium]